MEVGESDIRQRKPSATNPLRSLRGVFDPTDRDDRSDASRDHVTTGSNGASFDLETHSSSSMAAPALISPNTPYYPQHPSPFFSASGYHKSAGQTPPPAPGLISPVESRRTSDDHDMAAHRPALPSIQEVIGKAAPCAYQPPSAPPSMSSQSLPSPFSATGPGRPFTSDTPSDRQPSPRTLHPPSSTSSSLYNPRPDSLRPQLSGHSHSLSGVHISPQPPDTEGQVMTSQHHLSLQHQRQQEQQTQHLQHQYQPTPSHPYHQQPPVPLLQRDMRSGPRHEDGPPQSHQYPLPSSQQHLYAPQSVPQQPLPPPSSHQTHSVSHPMSPRHTGPSLLPSPFDTHQQSHLQEGLQDYSRSRLRYDQTVNRHFEAWSYAEFLARIGSNARTIYNFAEAFGSIAREEHGTQPIPGRMPGDREVCEMISNAEWLKTTLENLRSMVQQSQNIASDRGPAGATGRRSSDDLEVSMYSEPMAKPYTINEVKKRRGRVAPPGRCHSCNRIDTPEWRRGPDGARTLCNACGLHYAKLERKKQLESRQIRPKLSDDRP